MGLVLTWVKALLQTNSLPRGIVDKGVLEECAEDEEDADPGPDVDGLRVRHRWQRVLDTCLRGKSQYIFHTKKARKAPSYASSKLRLTDRLTDGGEVLSY